MTNNEAITVLMLTGDMAAEDKFFDLPNGDTLINGLVRSGKVTAKEVGGCGVEFIPTETAVTEARKVLA
jgi:hypothetical protein